MVRKIQGKGKSSSLGHLNVNNKKVTSKKDISNTLADAFSKNSSSENYTEKFKNIKQQKEKRNLKFSSDNSETYNQPFSLSELKDALSKAHDSSPGPDDIHYQFLKHLPDTSLSVLLKTFNGIWETGNVPKSWKEATIIPIPKPGKDNTNPNNYRPIALTSWGWSGGAMVLGKLPVLGRPTILIIVGQGPIALAVGAGGGSLDIFTLIYPFSSFSLSLGDGPI